MALLPCYCTHHIHILPLISSHSLPLFFMSVSQALYVDDLRASKRKRLWSSWWEREREREEWNSSRFLMLCPWGFLPFHPMRPTVICHFITLSVMIQWQERERNADCFFFLFDCRVGKREREGREESNCIGNSSSIWRSYWIGSANMTSLIQFV